MTSPLDTYQHPPPLLMVISGPSGVGKDAVLSRMRELGRPYFFTVTATTRPKRPTERDGVDYVFLTMERFQALRESGGFLEWAQVYGNWYGVPKAQVAEAMAQGRDVIVKIDVQGVATIRDLAPEGVYIFLAPPSLEELAKRLRERGSEAPLDLGVRLRTAREEMQQLSLFTYVVVNETGRLEEAVALIEAIMTAEKRRVGRKPVRL
ncbi:MAG: guanylate kinase [Dehalococcoidia bacterium]|nr:guanylate kinase [Dehalococcoidia bacterium]